MPSRPAFLRPVRRTRAGDVAGYTAAVIALVAGGAIFTRGILTWTRGPVVAIAAILLTGWAVDKVRARRHPGDDGRDGSPHDGPDGDGAGDGGEGEDR
ncbi:hypothetical protein [Streptomyces sp. CMB-StM0423]|uniref:hypothetical protein n=1 Tax=Streptomyces sp. CMB-StM0423 TaxID=2059884 RepID=UPI000C706C26|nr:hypothetical protein [Streptomyces sp. CMB-StM0423]AUH43185.1 hypothetical protein CXR04_26160 [Streptomyces sp. CMB-StM0423]